MAEETALFAQPEPWCDFQVFNDLVAAVSAETDRPLPMKGEGVIDWPRFLTDALQALKMKDGRIHALEDRKPA